MANKATPKTPEEISAEVARLKEMKPKVRRKSLFGDDNHAQIQAQIDALEGGLSSDQISRRFADDDNDYQAAMDALYWRNGQGEESPSDGWKDLVQE